MKLWTRRHLRAGPLVCALLAGSAMLVDRRSLQRRPARDAADAQPLAHARRSITVSGATVSGAVNVVTTVGQGPEGTVAGARSRSSPA